MNRFQAFFKRHSLIGSLVVYSGLYSGGDLARQTLQHVPEKDYVTTARMGVIGGCVLAPIFYGWYKILDSYLTGNTLKIIVKKVIIDQAVAGTSGVCLFYLGKCLQ